MALSNLKHGSGLLVGGWGGDLGQTGEGRGRKRGRRGTETSNVLYMVVCFLFFFFHSKKMPCCSEVFPLTGQCYFFDFC